MLLSKFSYFLISYMRNALYSYVNRGYIAKNTLEADEYPIYIG